MLRTVLPRVVVTSLAGAVVSTACAAARVPERATRCPLEPALAAFEGAREGEVCSSDAEHGCSVDCANRRRECVLRAAAAKEPFSARWVIPSHDSVYRRGAIVGRRSVSGAYEVRWFDYALVGRCGPPSNCGDRTHEGWTARACSDIGDLDAVCAGSIAGESAPPECALGSTQRRDVLGLACVGAARAGECTD